MQTECAVGDSRAGNGEERGLDAWLAMTLRERHGEDGGKGGARGGKERVTWGRGWEN